MSGRTAGYWGQFPGALACGTGGRVAWLLPSRLASHWRAKFSALALQPSRFWQDIAVLGQHHVDRLLALLCPRVADHLLLHTDRAARKSRRADGPLGASPHRAASNLLIVVVLLWRQFHATDFARRQIGLDTNAPERRVNGAAVRCALWVPPHVALRLVHTWRGRSQADAIDRSESRKNCGVVSRVVHGEIDEVVDRHRHQLVRHFRR